MNRPTQEFPLWAEGAPGALGTRPEDIPSITPFFPDPAVAIGASMVIFPGGGYEMHAGHEGIGYTEFFLQQGLACFVVKYRLATHGYKHPRMLQDAARAVRTVRAKAAEWGIDPARIGIIGSSAGGHLSSTLATHFDAGDHGAADPIERVSSRPDAVILCYAVVSMGDEQGHAGSRDNLLGKNAPPELVRELSNELQVTPQTPPCFVWHTMEDKVVTLENSVLFTMALRKAGVPFDLHVYQKGIHGIGLSAGLKPGSLHPWTEDCLFWLNVQGFLTSK